MNNVELLPLENPVCNKCKDFSEIEDNRASYEWECGECFTVYRAVKYRFADKNYFQYEPYKISAWTKVFRSFYNDNEVGGSSRWMVGPNSVKLFIQSLLVGQKHGSRKHSSTTHVGDFSPYAVTFDNLGDLNDQKFQEFARMVSKYAHLKYLEMFEGIRVNQQWLKDEFKETLPVFPYSKQDANAQEASR